VDAQVYVYITVPLVRPILHRSGLLDLTEDELDQLAHERLRTFISQEFSRSRVELVVHYFIEVFRDEVLEYAQLFHNFFLFVVEWLTLLLGL
jgi:hypothetical protein